MLKLPSVAPSSVFSSVNDSESLTASALTIFNRIGGGMTRSSSVVRRAAAFGFAGSSADCFRARLADLATVPPRDENTKGHMQHSESRHQERVPPLRRRKQAGSAESGECSSHHRHHSNAENAACHDAGAV